MLSILKAAIGLLFGRKSPIDALTETYLKHKDSAVESERVKADVAKRRLDNELDAQRGARQVRLATSGMWEMRLLTFLIAAPFVLHSGAVGLDTTFSFGWGIPAYPSPFDEWEGAILLSFFGLYAGVGGLKVIASAIATRR